MIVLRQKEYGEFSDRLRGAKDGLIGGAIGGGFLGFALGGFINWKIPLVTATLGAGIGLIAGWKYASIKLNSDQLEELNKIYPIRETLKIVSDIELEIKNEVKDLVDYMSEKDLLPEYITPALYTETIDKKFLEKIKTGKSVFLFGIGNKSIDACEYVIEGKKLYRVKRTTKILINDVAKDFKEQLINAWKYYRDNNYWVISMFGDYKEGIEEYEELHDINVKKEIVPEVNKRLDKIINKLKRL